MEFGFGIFITGQLVNHYITNENSGINCFIDEIILYMYHSISNIFLNIFKPREIWLLHALFTNVLPLYYHSIILMLNSEPCVPVFGNS